MTITDHTPALAETGPEGWTEPDITAWANEIAEDENRNAQLDRPSDVLAAEWDEDAVTDETDLPVDDSGPETECEPNLFRFCRFCGADMDTGSSDERNGS